MLQNAEVHDPLREQMVETRLIAFKRDIIVVPNLGVVHVHQTRRLVSKNWELLTMLPEIPSERHRTSASLENSLG